MNLAGKNVLVTGATGGIGRETALCLAKLGANLLLTSRDAAGLGRLQSELVKHGGDVRVVSADLATPCGRSALVATVSDWPGGLDVLINNAGASYFGSYVEQSQDSVNRLLAVNLAAPMLLTGELLPLLARSDHGVILNVGSIVGSIALPGQVTYSATKFALHGFSEALRRELADTGVSVVYFAPRSTDTGLNGSLQRQVNDHMGVSTDSPADVARQLVETLVAGQAERFLGWPERLFVKLNSLLPRLVDRSLRRQARIVSDATTPRSAALQQGAKS